MKLEDSGSSASKPKKEWALTDGNPLGLAFMRRTYSPLKQFPSLFRTFSDLAISEREALLDFANKYGLLGVYGGFLNVSHPSEPGHQVSAGAETYRDWAKAINAMKEAVRLWDYLREDDRLGLGKYIRWNPGETNSDGQVTILPNWGYDSHPDLPRKEIPFPSRRFTGVIADELERIGLNPQDLRAAAQLLVQRWINSQLEGNTAPRLLYHTELGEMVLQIVPSTLLAAMWLQFAQAIAANKVYRTCRECGNWFEVPTATDGRSERRVFCSDPCKSKDYRRRLADEITKKAQRSAIKMQLHPKRGPVNK